MPGCDAIKYAMVYIHNVKKIIHIPTHESQESND